MEEDRAEVIHLGKRTTWDRRTQSHHARSDFVLKDGSILRIFFDGASVLFYQAASDERRRGFTVELSSPEARAFGDALIAASLFRTQQNGCITATEFSILLAVGAALVLSVTDSRIFFIVMDGEQEGGARGFIATLDRDLLHPIAAALTAIDRLRHLNSEAPHA